MDVVGRENCLLIQPYGCSDGIERLDWEDHPYTDHILMKWSDCFETRKQSQVELFLGTAKLAKQHIAEEFPANIGGYASDWVCRVRICCIVGSRSWFIKAARRRWAWRHAFASWKRNCAVWSENATS